MAWSGTGTWRSWLRRALALACAVAALACVRREDVGVLAALPLGVFVALLALPELVRPFTWLVDVLFGTGPQAGARPPLDLRLAHFYLREERWEDAYAEYERILEYHPGVEEVYAQLFTLGARLGKPAGRMDRLYRRACRRVRDPEARVRLRRALDEAREELQGRA